MNLSKPDPDLQASASHGPRRQRRRFAWIGTAASLAIFAASIYVLWHMAAEMNAAEVKAAFTAATARQLGTAAGLTAVSYLLLTCYDALALSQLGLRVPYRTTALASFTSYAGASRSASRCSPPRRCATGSMPREASGRGASRA